MLIRLDVPREFHALCAVLGNPVEYPRHVEAIYRAEFNEMAHGLPIGFCRDLFHGGFRRVRSFLFFLGTVGRDRDGSGEELTPECVR